ncbi:restriction endonuclease [Streptomyces sp. NPDC048669]|uniref:restriction endonuclease n=1 Tax=Streptomyces sp. NPDC048669 TaxID=3155267 RepID=UPI00343F13C2
MGRTMRIGEVLRYTSEKDPTVPVIDGCPNFHFVTDSPGHLRALLEAGINGMRRVRTDDGERRPALLIRSSPWKAGSVQTPWHDVFDLVNGHVRYFGDHKVGSQGSPDGSKGNAALLDAFEGHQAPTAEGRAKAVPLLLFRSVTKNGKPKGHVEFCGVGIVERVERIVQWAGRERTTFTNYAYDIAVISLTAEDERLDWDWITARRDGVADAEVLSAAPVAWREWVEHGHGALPRVRRRVARSKVEKVREQRPAPDSSEERDLHLVYKHFDGRKHDFEALASGVAARILRQGGHAYREGWLTRLSGDGGADFVGRLDLGTGLSGTSLVVLGQAKCILPASNVSAEQIARVVARLRRGWIGVYVTTGSYSEAAQLEMIEDQYPILLVNGRDLVREIRAIARDDHGGDLIACVEHLVDHRAIPIAHRKPEEILLL